MAHDVLSSSTRKTKIRLINSSAATIVVNTFGIELQGWEVLKIPEEAQPILLPLLLGVSTLYLFIMFSLYSLDDYLNREKRSFLRLKSESEKQLQTDLKDLFSSLQIFELTTLRDYEFEETSSLIIDVLKHDMKQFGLIQNRERMENSIKFTLEKLYNKHCAGLHDTEPNFDGIMIELNNHFREIFRVYSKQSKDIESPRKWMNLGIRTRDFFDFYFPVLFAVCALLSYPFGTYLGSFF